MLEHLQKGVGQAMHVVQAGAGSVIGEREGFDLVPFTISLESAAFDDGDQLPRRFTADGDKISPPLSWSNIPKGAKMLVLAVEDPDASSLEPLVHLLALFPADAAGIPEGKFSREGAIGMGNQVGRNSYLRAAYLPPDPPRGHGSHHYVFQLFALDCALDVVRHPGRSVLVEAMYGHVLAKGSLTGVYART